MKKIFVLLINICITLNLTCCFKTSARLVCDTNGDFTILIVSDPQCDNIEEWIEAKNELETLVKKAKPNLVIINGDMNSANRISDDMWSLFITPLTDRNIYWATTNGNHDPFTKHHYNLYKTYKNCLNETVSPNDKNYVASRPMNYVIPIYSNDNKTIVFAIYGMDSGTENRNGYDGLTTKQINWYIDKSNTLKRINGGKALTSVLCMHIPLPQVIDLFYSTPEAKKATEKIAGGLYDVYGIANEPNEGIKNYTCENGTFVATTRLHTTAPANDRGLFNTVLKQQDIKAMIFGHDHRTNFIGSYKGVLLGFAGKISSGCYSDNLCRGGRIIKFNQSNPEEFTVSWLGALETSADQPPIYSDGTPQKEKSDVF